MQRYEELSKWQMVLGHLVLFAQGESVVESVNWAVVRRGSFHLLVPVAVVAVEDDAPLLLLVRRRRLAGLFGLLLVLHTPHPRQSKSG